MRNATEQPKGMLAGKAATELGVGVQTLHFYEREGLIPPPQRAHNGYRVYDAPLLEQVRFIRKAQSLGLTLHDVKEILGLAERGRCPCGHVHRALAARLNELNERLKELGSFQAELAALVNRAARVTSEVRRSAVGRNAATRCPIVEEAIAPVQLPRAHSRPRLKGRSKGSNRSAGSF